jgi:hypothetical protein
VLGVTTAQTITADVESSIFVTVRIPSGTWVRGIWSIVAIKFEIYRQGVLDALRAAYESQGVSPASLPPMDAVTGKGPVR